MDQLLIAKNILLHRQQLKITQEQLANMLGVTKAAVSKWETGQSLPDILILPKLATYFNVSIDELMGYSRQMSATQIQALYKSMTESFATLKIDDAIANCRDYVKDYYHCYPLLVKICGLYVNHLDLITDATAKESFIKEIIDLCEHINKHCDDFHILMESKTLISVTYLMSQQPELALKQIGPDEKILLPESSLRAQCYLLLGQPAKAEKSLQIVSYQLLLCLVQSLIDYLPLQMQNQALFEETYRRANLIVEAFNMSNLHPATTTKLYYVAAIGYMQFGQHETALLLLKKFAYDIKQHLFPLKLKGDSFFNLIPAWFEEMHIALDAPRDPVLVKQSLMQSLAHPAFTAIHTHPEFVQIQHDLQQL